MAFKNAQCRFDEFKSKIQGLEEIYKDCLPVLKDALIWYSTKQSRKDLSTLATYCRNGAQKYSVPDEPEKAKPEPTDPNEKLWVDVCEELRKIISAFEVDNWFSDCSVEIITDDEVLVSTPSDETKIYIEENYLELLGDTVSSIKEKRIQIHVMVAECAISEG